jgi:adenylate cyclase
MQLDKKGATSSRPRKAGAPTLRQIRLTAGLVLFAYATLHFANHALGNISVGAMETGLKIQKWIWQSTPGAVVLYSALASHMALGFWALYERRHFRWTRMEATQLALGLAIPLLLTDHLLGTRVSLSLFGTEKGYAEILATFWVRSPISGVLQAALLLTVWIHGCIGVLSWLSLNPFYPRVRDTLLPFAVMLPALALLGYYQTGRRMPQLTEDPLWRAQHMIPGRVGTAVQNAALLSYRNATLVVLAAALAAIMLARLVRRWRKQRPGLIRLTYPDRVIRVPRGLSVWRRVCATTFRTRMSAVGAAAAPPAASAFWATQARFHLPVQRSKRCSTVSARMSGSGSRASFAQLSTSPSCPCFPRIRRSRTSIEVGQRGLETSGTSS